MTYDEAAGVAVERESLRSTTLLIGQKGEKTPPASVLQLCIPQLDPALSALRASPFLRGAPSDTRAMRDSLMCCELPELAAMLEIKVPGHNFPRTNPQ